jgi:hypothetical protein
VVLGRLRPVPAQRLEIYASPLQATTEQLTGLPPTLIQVAGNDVLLDEGLAYVNGDLSLGTSGSQLHKPLLDGLGSRVDFSSVRIAIRETDEDVMFLICPVDSNGRLI